MKFILIILLFSVVVFGDENNCSSLRSSIAKLDEKINKTPVLCSNNPGRFQAYCKDNLSELKEKFRIKMNELIILDGIKGIKKSIAANVKDIQLLKDIDVDTFKTKVENFEFSLERGALVQESFYANEQDEFFFLGFQDFLNGNTQTGFSKEYVEKYFENNCQGKSFSVCNQYNTSKSKYQNRPGEWEELLKSLYGVGVASAKYKDENKDVVKAKFGEFISHLNIPIVQGSEGKPTKMVDLLNPQGQDALLAEVQSAITNMKSNPTKMNAKALNEASNTLKKKMDVFQDLTIDSNNLNNDLIGAKTNMQVKYQELAVELNKVIKNTYPFDPESLEKSKENAIKQIKQSLEISKLKDKQKLGEVVKDIKSAFNFECKSEEIDSCKEKLEKFKNATCSSSDATCEAQKDTAKKYLKNLDKVMEGSDQASLKKALACYESDAINDPQQLIICIHPGNLDLEKKLVDLKNELDVIQEMIGTIENTAEIDQLNLLKAIAINKLDKNPECNTDQKEFYVNTSCKLIDHMKDSSIKVLLDQAGDVLSFYNMSTFGPSLEKEVNRLKKICELDKYKYEYEEICKDPEQFKRKQPTIITGPTLENEFDDYTPDYRAWAEKIQKSRRNTPGAMTGLVGGFVGDFIPGYMSYNQSSQMNDAQIQWAFDSKQEMLNWNAHKEKYFEDFYIWQLNNYYYPSFAGGKWDYYTDPFNPNFNYNSGPYIYPPSSTVYSNGSLELNFPAVNYTNGNNFVGQDPYLNQ